MDVVRLNGGHIGLAFKAYITGDILQDDYEKEGRAEVIVYFDEVEQEYVIAPRWNRVKEKIKTINLTGGEL